MYIECPDCGWHNYDDRELNPDCRKCGADFKENSDR